MTGHGSFFQSKAWAELHAEPWEEAIYNGSWLLRGPYGGWGPVHVRHPPCPAGARFGRKPAVGALRLVREVGAATGFIRFDPFHCPWALSAPGCKVLDLAPFVVIDDGWDPSMIRHSIGPSAPIDVVATGPDRLEEIAALHGDAMTRAGRPDLVRSAGWLQRMSDYEPDWRQFSALIDGRLAAVAVFIDGVYWLAAATPDGRTAGAAKLVVGTALTAFLLGTVNLLGGQAAGDGIEMFKRRFGGTVMPHNQAGMVVADQAAYEAACATVGAPTAVHAPFPPYQAHLTRDAPQATPPPPRRQLTPGR